MQLEEHIKFNETQIEKSKFYREEALKKNDFRLAALNIRCCFLESLELGLIYWRLGENPESYLRHALDGILKDRETLIKRGAALEIVNKLPFYYSIYLASLLNCPHHVVDLGDINENLVPGAFLGNILIGVDVIDNWPKYQDKMPKQKRTALARATFELYAGMLSGKISAKEGVAKGEIYYSRREDDQFFSDSPVLAGGTHLNNRFVDFRLAAVLKHIGSTVPSIHAWRW